MTIAGENFIWRWLSRRLILPRRLAWLMQITHVLPIERGKRGLDRGAEAGYASPNALPKERYPNPRPQKNFWRPNRGGASRVQFAIQFRAMFGSEVVEEFRAHFSVTTSHSNWLDFETHA